MGNEIKTDPGILLDFYKVQSTEKSDLKISMFLLWVWILDVLIYSK